MKKIYFLGIGGIGMSALARYFQHQGAAIWGYDRTETPLTRQLTREGMHIHYTDDPHLIPPDLDMVVYTPAIPNDLLEWRWFQQKNIPVKKRAEVLGLISRHKKVIGVGGTHGKTSTTTLTAYLLQQSDVAVSAFLGGISGNFKTNFVAGSSDWVVIEADEYDRSFLHLQPTLAVINSMDADHLDIYQTTQTVHQAYRDFARNLQHGGVLIAKHGLPLSDVAEELRQTGRYFYTFGIEQGDFMAQHLHVKAGRMTFDLKTPTHCWKALQIHLPGRHNVENAVAATAAAMLAGANPKKIPGALRRFKGVRRRFEVVLRRAGMVFIDDYAHHPAELEATIAAARMLFPDRKLTGIFQPHLYSRTRDFAPEFAAALSTLDEVLLLPIYPAREQPIEGVSSETLARQIKNRDVQVLNTDELLQDLKNRPIEILLTMGAGNIDQLVSPIKKILTARVASSSTT